MKKEHGFTLVELIITVAVMSCIFVVLGTALSQIITVPEYGDARITAMHEIQNVAHWVSIDGQMAKAAVGGDNLSLTMADDSNVSYNVEGTELHRISGSTDRTLAQNIRSASFSIQDRVITMNLTSSPEGRWNASENGTYQVCLRSVQE